MSPTANVLDQILDPFTECLTPEVAERIVSMRASPEMQARLDGLAQKANEGRLSDEEAAEYDKFREGFHFITILQTKAGVLLRNRSSG